MPGLKPRHPKPAEPSAPKPEEKPPGPSATQAAAPAHAPAESVATRPAHEPESHGPEVDDDSDTSHEEEMELRVNPRIEKEIADYKAAYPRSVEYFTRLVKENPDRAINFHFRDKQKQHKVDTQRAMRQMPQAQALYDQMSPDSKARVEQRLETANKYSHTKRFVWSVRREMNRAAAAKNSQMMNTPVIKIAAESPAPGAPKPEVAAAQPSPAAPKMGVG